MRAIAAAGLLALIAIAGAAGPAAAGQTPAGRAPADAARPATVPPPASQLYDVSCVSAKDCVAVGVNDNAEANQGGDLALIQSWNGKAWKTVAAPIPKGGLWSSLGGVSCSTASACVAVGYLDSSDVQVPLAEIWNGRTWTLSAPPRPAGSQDGQLSGVSCAGTRSCVAVGTYSTNTTSVALAESWNGKAWTLSKPPEPKGSMVGGLEKVSCPTATSCRNRVLRRGRPSRAVRL